MSPAEFWKKFLSAHPELSQDLPLDAWSFGGNSDALLELVLSGKKTATCSLLSVYDDGSIPLPKAGTYSVILDSKGNPKCVVLLKETFVRKFSEIDAQHAFEEGEGDRSLEYWRGVHLKFFSVYERFSEQSEILCERFKVVWV